ncbi:HORMA domain-containing protein [Kalaharituber pfeilii]|nr:HORMA domain-containing protein [Kalaharituber pfeilii]
MQIGGRQTQRVRLQPKSLQKAKEIEVVKQSIKQEQSLEIIKTLLGASVSTVTPFQEFFHDEGLLPEESFEEVRYGGHDTPLANYHWFANSESGEGNHERGGTDLGTRMKRLKRGYSAEANHLLNWLEHGIFEALAKTYLKAVQLAIYKDEHKPDVIAETYTFSFSYRLNNDGSPVTPTGFNVKDTQGNEITVANTSRSIQHVMRRLILITQNLPPIPDTRYLTIRLHYTDWTPETYSPPFFRRLFPQENRLKFREDTKNSVLNKIVCGSVATGHHGVSLKVAAFHEPDEIQTRVKRVRTQLVHIDEDIEAPSINGPVPAEHNFTLGKGQSQPGVEACQPLRDSILIKKSIINASPCKNGLEKDARELREANAFRQMLLSPKHRDDLVETQPDTNSSLQISPQAVSQQPAQAPPTQMAVHKREAPFITSHVPDQDDEAGVVPMDDSILSQLPISNVVASQKLKLSNSKIAELERAKLLRAKLNENQRNQSQKKTSEVDIVTCECGDREEDGDMIACEICNGWLHVHCYGYKNANDERIPDFVACYSCLLPTEFRLLEEMNVLALFRKGLKKVWDDGYPTTNKKFAELLGCDLQMALEITRCLESEGFITTKTNRSHKKGSNTTSKYTVIKTEDTIRKMDVEYFDPLTKISHHFDLPCTFGAPNGSLQETCFSQRIHTPACASETGDELDHGSDNLKRHQAASSFRHLGKAKATVHVAESQKVAHMDIDFDEPGSSRKTVQQASNVEARGNRIEASPWRKHVGVCEEGVLFPAVF